MNQLQVTDGDPAGKQLSLSQLTDLLSDLSKIEQDPELQLVELKGGQVLFEQGEIGDSMYVLIAGALGVRVKLADGSETVIDKLAPGALVGEMALLSGQERSATVYALNDAGLIRLSKKKFEQLAEEDKEAVSAIDEAMKPRWQRLQLVTILRHLFGELDMASLHSLQDKMEWFHFSNGGVLFRQGDRPDGMYIVVNGRLRITVTTPEGTENVIGEIGPGETVGEYGLLTDEARSATVYGVRETNVVRITPAVFEGLLRDYPVAMAQIARIIVERQQRTLKGIKGSSPAALTIALLPASSKVDGWLFAQELGTALTEYGSSLALDGRRFDERYGQPGASLMETDDDGTLAMAAWMDELEANHHFIIYVADPARSDWTRRCIGQADRVLILADSREDPAPGPAESLLQQLEVPVHAELVLWHPPETVKPAGTAAWLDARHVDGHHHIRRDDEGHMARLARRLSGHAVGLVLSSGGARGYAQLGVYRAMLELDIPLDYVGGSSMGSLIGGSLALGLDYDELLRRAGEIGTSSQIFDYTLPFTSLAASKKVTRVTQKAFGDINIEDLWIPYFCVATNLSRAEPVVFQRGPLWRAVRASLAIPGVFTPVIDDGEVLVDGGVMDSFPAETMARLCQSDSLIGVHVKPHQDRKRQYDMDTSISGWRILYHRLNPFKKPLRSPSLIGTVMHSTEVNGLRLAKNAEKWVALMIYPDVKEFGPMDYDAQKAIIQAGYDAAIEPLRRWWNGRSEG